MTVQEQASTASEVIQYEVDGRRRHDLAEPARGQELRQLGAADQTSARALERAEDDDDVRVVLIRGRGNTFCAGADLNMLDSRVPRHDEQLGEDRPGLGPTFDRASNLAKPTIAVVEGYAVAGGFELMISCDFCIAADEAKIGDFHIRRALFGGAGPIYRLPRYHRPAQDQGAAAHRQAALGQGGGQPSGASANVSAPADQLDEAVADFVAPMADKSAFCMRSPSSPLNRGLDGDTETLIVIESMACNVVHHSERRQGGRGRVPREARSGLEARLA